MLLDKNIFIFLKQVQTMKVFVAHTAQSVK